METPTSCKDPLRVYLSADFRSTRKALGFTQARMAEELGIDVRSYADLENGKNLCSTPVFIRYLTKFKKDKKTDDSKEDTFNFQFIQEVGRILSSADARLV